MQLWVVLSLFNKQANRHKLGQKTISAYVYLLSLVAQVELLAAEQMFCFVPRRCSSFACNNFMAPLASESSMKLQIRLQTIILSYGLAQDEVDLTPFTVSTREIAMKQAWKHRCILAICRKFLA